jgi:hypothetical protein
VSGRLVLEIVLHVPPAELSLNVESAMRKAARAGRTVVRRRAREGGGLAAPKDGGRPLRRTGEFIRSLDVRRYRGVDRTGRGLTSRLIARFKTQPPDDRAVFLVVPTGRRKDRMTKGGRSRRVTTNYGLGRVLAVPGKGRELVLTMFRTDAELRSVIQRAYAEALVAQLTRRSARRRTT